MHLAISNLAWPAEQDSAVASLLGRLGVPGVELAPTRIWPAPVETTPTQRRDCRRFWEDAGVRIVSLQALLFGRPDLILFDGPERRQATFDYLARMCTLGGDLGARVLVFGSPRNRSRGSVPLPEAEAVAVEFFRRLARVARQENVILGIEPNPPAYHCDFLTTAERAAHLVREVDDPGLGLHLDSACIALAGEDLEAVLAAHRPLVCSFHASEPSLRPIDADTLGHARFGAILRRIGFRRQVSIEMLPFEDGFQMDRLERCLRLAQEWYVPVAGCPTASTAAVA